MLIAIYHIIQDDAEFKPNDYDEIVNPKPSNNVPKMTVENVLWFLQEQGADEQALQILKKQYCSI